MSEVRSLPGMQLRMSIKKITKEDLTNGYDYFLTVGQLKKFLDKHQLPDQAKVVVQRVEDRYFEGNNWGVYLKEGDNTFKDDNGVIDEETLSQYHPAFCCVKYNDEDDVLFIDMHY